jgi:hypothetical protein
MKEETAHRVRAGDVRAQATLGSFAHTDQKKDGGSKAGLTGTLWWNCSGWEALRREPQERLESNLHESWATGKKGETDHKVISTALGKEEMAVCR